jgi:hypothetical protein
LSYSEEVARCFEENPNLVKMSPSQLGEWFYIQGILYQSNVVAAVESKFTHFIKHLTKAQKEKADKSWKTVNSFCEAQLEKVEDE